MRITKSTTKTKKFLQKTIKNLTSFFSERYQKLPKSHSLNPLASCSKTRTEDELCSELPYDLKADLDKNTVLSNFKGEQDHDDCSEGFEKISKPMNIPPTKNNERSRRVSSSRDMDASGRVLAEKMKELDMMEEGDMEHAIDVEEALHYYSRLRSPVYLDIVDNFFMDMYSEFNNVPQPSLSTTNSRRRKGSFRF